MEAVRKWEFTEADKINKFVLQEYENLLNYLSLERKGNFSKYLISFN